MKLTLAYGREGLPVELPDRNVTVLEPTWVPGVADEPAALRAALRRPIASRPVAELVRPSATVAVVFSDLTRPMPSDRVLPVLLDELSHVPDENIVLINALGTHRANTEDELIRMLGAEIVRRYRIVQHDGNDRAGWCTLGRSSYGHDISVNSTYMDAEVKILTGFIEPHFFAGFSGGPKAVLPGVAGEETMLRKPFRADAERPTGDLGRHARATRCGRRCARPPK